MNALKGIEATPTLIALQFCYILFPLRPPWPLCNLLLRLESSPHTSETFQFLPAAIIQRTCRLRRCWTFHVGVGGNSVKIIRRLDKKDSQKKGFFFSFSSISSFYFSHSPSRFQLSSRIRPINFNLMAFRNMHHDFHSIEVAFV